MAEIRVETGSSGLRAGLEGVVAAETRLSSVDGQKGELIIGGFPLESLAGNATFEETVHLLWYDALPDAQRYASLRGALADRRRLPAETLELLRAAARDQVGGMDALRMGASTLSLVTGTSGWGAGGTAGVRAVDTSAGGAGATLEPPAGISAGDFEDALSVTARFPTLVAAWWRLVQGQEPLEPDQTLSHAANYLYMLTGERPTAERVRGMETYLNTVVDHGLNASTFTARVIISTRSDMISAVVGAVGALKGPLHGGAPGPALDMVFEIGRPDRAEAFLRGRLEQGERLMGFGHRVYKVRDPRAEVLAAAAGRLFRSDGDPALYELAREVERTAVRLLAEYKPGRNLQTNVEFYTALLLHGLGLSTALFTPTFAISRVAGWTAHCFEQLRTDRLIRPQSMYAGARGRKWVPLEAR